MRDTLEGQLPAKEKDVFQIPQTAGSWIFLLVACFVGFMIGRWINKRRQKGNDIIPLMTQPKKHLSKKERRKAGRGKS